jgi:hypothetical protein
MCSQLRCDPSETDCRTHLSQSFLVFCQSIVTFREDVFLPQFSNSAAGDLDVSTKRFRVSRAVALDHDTFLHPFVDLFVPQIDLPFYARRQFLFER